MGLPDISNNQLALLNAGIGGLEGWFGGQADDRRDSQNQLGSLAAMMAQLQARENQYKLAASQMDPLAQQRARAEFAQAGDVRRNQTPVSHSFDPATGFASLSGGARMPEGGWSDDTLGFFDPASRANAEAEFYGAAGMPYDLAGAGYGDAAGPQAGGGQGASSLLSQRLAERISPQDAFTNALNNPSNRQQFGASSQQQGGGKPWWQKALGAVGAVAPIAASFIPGVGPLASMGIGAGIGALTGALSGGRSGAVRGAAQGGGSAMLGNYLSDRGALNHNTPQMPQRHANPRINALMNHPGAGINANGLFAPRPTYPGAYPGRR